MPCFDQAAEAFGWSKRNAQPGSMRDGDWLVGWGCATSAYPTQMAPASRARPPVPGRHGACRDGQPRDRQRHLHGGRADGGRAARPALREGHGRCSATPTCRRRPSRAARSRPRASARWWPRPATRSGRKPDAMARRRRVDLVAVLKERGVGRGRGICRMDAARRRRRARCRRSTRAPPMPIGGAKLRGSHPVRLRGAIRRGADPCPHARDPRAAHRRRLRVRPHHEHPDGAQPVHGRHDLGHRLGAARADRDRHQRGPLRQHQPRRLSRPGECRRGRRARSSWCRRRTSS